MLQTRARGPFGRTMGLLLAGTAAFAGTPLLAQAADTSATASDVAPQDDQTDSGGIGDIIVTATRRAENLQDVPLSVSAVNSEQLDSRGIIQTTDLAAVVPNLKVNSQYGDTQPNFSLRGVGVANEYNSNTASPIGVYVDEVYQSFRFTHGLQLYDLERVEVLRGPQGTLFGRNTTGGAVSIYTRQPKLSGNNGYVTLGYGNYDRFTAEAAIEATPVEDKVGVRIAATRSSGSGFWKETNPSGSLLGNKTYATSDNFGVRGTLRVKPTENLDIVIKGYFAEDDPIGSPIFARGLIGGVPGTNFFGYSREGAGLKYNEYNLDSAGKYYTRTVGGSLTMTLDLGAASLTSVTGYSDTKFDLQTDNDGSPQDIFSPRYRADATDFSQDLRLNYQNDSVKLLVGAYYGKDTSDSVNDVRAFNVFPDATSPGEFNPGGSVDPLAPPTSLNAQYGYVQRRQSYALYGEGTYSLTEALELTVGLRYTHDKLEFNKAFSNAYDDLPGTILFPLYAPFSQGNTSNNLSGRAIVNYKWTDDIRTYVSYSRGYRSGAYNGFAYVDASQVYFLKPEKLDSFEGGFKSRFFDDRLQLNGAVFHYKYENQQVSEIVGAVGFLRSLNAKVTGAELELLARPVRALTLRGSAGYLDTKYDDNQFLSGIDIGGNRLPFASKWTGTIGADLKLGGIGSGEFVATGEVNYVSSYFYDPFNEEAPGFSGVLNQPGAEKYLTQDGYALVSARLAYIGENFNIAIWGKNLTNKKYFPVGYDVTGAFGNTIYNAGSPRTYGVSATIKF